MATSFGETLKEARKRGKKTLKEVGQVAGLSLSYISDMEQGRKKSPAIEIVRKIEAYLGITDGSLVKSANSEVNTRNEMRTIFRKRPELNTALLRVAEDCTEEEVNDLINEMLKRKGKLNE